MKHTYLSNFQKQQYTAYLQTQLEKFSAFMLSQRKENEKYRTLEQLTSYHSKMISQLQSKMESIGHYQHQSFLNSQNLFKRCQKQEDFEIRLRRLEDRQRYDCDRHAKKPSQNGKIQPHQGKGNEHTQHITEGNYPQINKRLRRLQQQLHRIQSQSLLAKNKVDDTELISWMEDNTSHRLKKVEKKMKKYFNEKFQSIEDLMKKSKRRKSKSPVAKTPLDRSISSQYVIQQLERPLTQFKLQDHSTNKSDLSTILRASKNTTTSNKNKDSNCHKIKSKRRRQSDQQGPFKSKSKDKTKQLDKQPGNKDKRKSKSKSKNRRHSISKGLSQKSCIHSSMSKSRSNISSISKSKNGKPQKNALVKRSVSRERSNCSSISLHQRCKKRAQPQNIAPQRSKSKQKHAVSKKSRKNVH